MLSARFQFITLLLFVLFTNPGISQSWNSSLYPPDWQPGYSDSAGRFLHDFSYAGYHSGLKEIPFIEENILDVTKPPYNADNTGKTDVTTQIQQAIDDAGNAGGGVVYLPAGEYAISLQDQEALLIKHSRVVLRGDGPEKTFLKNTSTIMRLKRLISFQSDQGQWSRPQGNVVDITEDILLPTTVIPVEDAAVFSKGDLVVVINDCTEAFITEHKAENLWDTRLTGPRFCRFVTGVNRDENTIEIDAPTRYFLKRRDHARVYKIGPQLEECGVEDLSIGNIQNQKKGDWQDQDMWTTEQSGPYEVHASVVFGFRNAMNCWMRNVATYRPEENKDDVHILSMCLRLSESRFITIQDCDFRKPQYEGGGGNGYLYTLSGNDCLIISCHAENSRHNYDLNGMSSNGNVIYNCTSKDPYGPSDFHMFLSMANLFDSFISEGDYIDARFRPWGGKYIHGYSATQNVMWNTTGLKPHPWEDFVIDSRQFGWGYVIGTSGPVDSVNTKPVSGVFLGYDFDTSPEDFVEGEGKGEWLLPQSLYMDQLKKRRARINTQKNHPDIPQL